MRRQASSSLSSWQQLPRSCICTAPNISRMAWSTCAIFTCPCACTKCIASVISRKSADACSCPAAVMRIQPAAVCCTELEAAASHKVHGLIEQTARSEPKASTAQICTKSAPAPSVQRLAVICRVSRRLLQPCRGWTAALGRSLPGLPPPQLCDTAPALAAHRLIQLPPAVHRLLSARAQGSCGPVRQVLLAL